MGTTIKYISITTLCTTLAGIEAKMGNEYEIPGHDNINNNYRKGRVEVENTTKSNGFQILLFPLLYVIPFSNKGMTLKITKL